MSLRLINPQHFHFPLLALSIAMIAYGLWTDDWPCGNLFTKCFKTIPLIIVLVLLGAGLGGLAIIFIVDLFGCCNNKWLPGPFCTSVKLLLLFVSSCAVMAGSLFYTYWYLPYWSYTLTVIGGVTSVQVILLALLNCRCLGAKL